MNSYTFYIRVISHDKTANKLVFLPLFQENPSNRYQIHHKNQSLAVTGFVARSQFTMYHCVLLT